MKQNIYHIPKAIAIIALAITAISVKADRQYESLCTDGRTWVYSEYYNSRPQRLQHKVYYIDGTIDIEGYTYHNCYAYDYDEPENTLVLAAFLREQDGKVYMRRLGAERDLGRVSKASYNGYNYFLDEEGGTLIYDFTVNEGEVYQVGKEEIWHQHPRDWMYGDFITMATDYGRIGCISTSDIKFSDRNRKQLELRIAPARDGKDSYYAGWYPDSFYCIEGIGLASTSKNDSPMGYMPFPYTAEMSLDWPYYINLLYVCDNGDFNKVIYRQDGLPENPQEYFDTLGVDDIVADSDAMPEYYNIQGMRVVNPQEGEIYIVKRGTRASKEVYRH